MPNKLRAPLFAVGLALSAGACNTSSPEVGSSPEMASTTTLAPNRGVNPADRIAQPTIQEIADFAKQPELLRRPVVKSFSFASGETQNHVFVLEGGQDVVPDSIQKKIGFLSTIAQTERIEPLNFKNQEGQQVQSSFRLKPEPAPERFYMMVPNDFPSISALTPHKVSFTYRRIEKDGEVDQEISFVFNEPGLTNGLALPKAQRDLNTELCQSTIRVQVPNSEYDMYGQSVADLGQERFCNAMGEMITASSTGVSYERYAESVRDKKISAGGLIASQFVSPPDWYAQAQSLK
jgi:hypothetical protein